MIRTAIVEDDPMVAEINRRYLEMIDGFEFKGKASTVDQAFQLLENTEVDLILLDIHMPGLNGWDFLSTIRGSEKNIDVIIITASCDKESIKKGLRYGAVDYLIKPFEFHRFQTALLSYKNETWMMDSRGNMNQFDLDNLLHHADQVSLPELELPKGLTKITLKKVWNALEGMEKKSLNTEELAYMVGISRVSMRKYVSFLVERKILETEIVFGTVGRPVYMHRLIRYDEELIGNLLR